MNPHKEGEYLCYGEAVKLSEHEFVAYYFVEHVPINGIKKCALEKKRFGTDTYPTADLARLSAVSAGQMWVRNLADKKEI